MATIRSYTDLSQSKALANILPLESADMKILPFNEEEYRIVPINDIAVCDREDEICAWSLAALLGVITNYGIIDLRFLQSTFDNKGNHLTNVWCCTFEDIGTITLDLYADNPVDACYEIILKLNELKLL